MLICNDRLTNIGLTSDYVYNFVSDSHFYLRYDNALYDVYSDHIYGVPLYCTCTVQGHSLINMKT